MIKFNGKYLQELIYLKARQENKSKAWVRKQMIKSFKVTTQTLSLWIGGLIPGIENLFKLKKFFDQKSIEDFFNQGGDIKNKKD